MSLAAAIEHPNVSNNLVSDEPPVVSLLEHQAVRLVERDIDQAALRDVLVGDTTAHFATIEVDLDDERFPHAILDCLFSQKGRLPEEVTLELEVEDGYGSYQIHLTGDADPAITAKYWHGGGWCYKEIEDDVVRVAVLQRALSSLAVQRATE